jgi:alpha-amylase/alpha-mannosidase (GH57 family)
MGVHKTQRMDLALTCLERYYKDGDEFLSQIVRVTCDETWVSFVNVETKEQSKQ